ncbi:MAG: site-2 protease family protein [Candidatus Staskawiczbacteria bacterium]|nr:site-2 protease family protein [Candidatus Staskawiczbacteria bacterium]MBI3337546.1 site-2 protease family protein [Candidatus Staskawiczbacteria bacterium]
MISIILTLIIAFLSLISLMVIHEFGHFIIAKKFGVRVEEFGIGYPPRIFGKKFGETLYSVNLLPLGAFVKIYGEEGDVDDYRSFSNLVIWKRVLIIIGGVVAFWIASIVLFSIVFAIGADIPIGDEDVVGLTNTRVQVILIAEDSPAKAGGLELGDVMLSFKTKDGEIKINKIKDVQDFTKENIGKQITLVVQRQDKTVETLLTPRALSPEGQGALGVGLERMGALINKYPWYQAPIKGTLYTGEITIKAVQGLFAVFKDLFSGNGVPQGAEMLGPIGITVFLARAVDFGPGFFLYFIASISVFVAIFNIFPIPALDGGKLIFLTIEKLRGKPVSTRVEQNITAVFFFLLILMSLFVTIKFDIPRLTEFLKSSLQR